MDCVVFESAAFELYPTRSSWDAAAADLVHTMLERWQLTPGAAFVGGESASVLEVTTADGVPAVLKVGFPHPEAVAEALALEVWSPWRAPAVLRQDPWTWSLLLERIRPGESLRESPLPTLERVRIGAQLLREVNAVEPPQGIPSLADVVTPQLEGARTGAQRHASTLAAIGATRDVERGLDELASLIASESATGLVHGDLNPHNILLGPRWMVIDPKPMVGGPEFDVWPLVTQLGDLAHLDERLQASRFGTDRAVRWGVARSALDVLWAIDEGVHPDHAVTVLRAWCRLTES